MDAYTAVGSAQKRPPPADEPLAITNTSGPPPPPPAPDAARVKRAALAIADAPVRPSNPPAPAPLEPPTAPTPKRPLPLTDTDRELPSGPMENKKKPRALAIEDRHDVPPKKVEKVEKVRDKEGKRAKPVYGYAPGVRRTIQKRDKPRQSQPDEEPEPDPEVLKPARTTRKRGGTARGRVRIVKV